jgi:hypothetical protein
VGRSTPSLDNALDSIYPDRASRDPFDNLDDFIPKTYIKDSVGARKRYITTATSPNPPAEPVEPITPPIREAFIIEISSLPLSIAVNDPSNNDIAADNGNTPIPITGAEEACELIIEPLGATDPSPVTDIRSDAELTAYVIS